MENHQDFLPVSWLEQLVPKCSEIQKSILSDWFQRMCMHISEWNLSEEVKNELLKEKVFAYFFPHYVAMRSPFELPDIKTAISILRESYEKKNKVIVLYGDRDADGISALAILYLFFRDQLCYPESKLIPMLPKENDKYGITEEVVERILMEEPDIFIALDCGSSNHKEINSLLRKSEEKSEKRSSKKASLQTIIIDHHFIPDDTKDYPTVDAFINPKRLSLGNPNRELCTAGLAYKLIWALTYSFTTEYDKLYKVTGHEQSVPPIDFKNLVHEISNQNIKDYKKQPATKEEHSLVELPPLWNHMVSSHSFFVRLQSFMSSVGFSLRLEDQARFLFQANLKNIWKKTRNYLIFATIGSIADMVSLVDDNRIIVKEGLALVNQNLKVTRTSHPSIEGVLALIRLLLSQHNDIKEEDFAFMLCPAINAGGRLGEPEVAFQSLVEKDRLLAVKKASALKKINTKRKKISKSMTEEIVLECKPNSSEKNIMVVYNSKVHRGISGLVANHVAEHFDKPALILVNDGDSIRGSIRSSQNQNVFSFLVKLEHFFIQFGGHKQAAGFSLEKNKLEAFIQAAEELGKNFFLEKDNTTSQNGEGGEDDTTLTHTNHFKPIPIFDHELTTSIWQECSFFTPFGQSNPTPRLAITLTQPVECSDLGKTGEHARIKFLGLTNPLIEGVWFFHRGEIAKLKENSAAENKLQQTFLAEPGISTWGGRKVYRLKITQLLMTPTLDS